jgi:hypothetical protein
LTIGLSLSANINTTPFKSKKRIQIFNFRTSEQTAHNSDTKSDKETSSLESGLIVSLREIGSESVNSTNIVVERLVASGSQAGKDTNEARQDAWHSVQVVNTANVLNVKFAREDRSEETVAQDRDNSGEESNTDGTRGGKVQVSSNSHSNSLYKVSIVYIKKRLKVKKSKCRKKLTPAKVLF